MQYVYGTLTWKGLPWPSVKPGKERRSNLIFSPASSCSNSYWFLNIEKPLTKNRAHFTAPPSRFARSFETSNTSTYALTCVTQRIFHSAQPFLILLWYTNRSTLSVLASTSPVTGESIRPGPVLWFPEHKPIIHALFPWTPPSISTFHVLLQRRPTSLPFSLPGSQSFSSHNMPKLQTHYSDFPWIGFS